MREININVFCQVILPSDAVAKPTPPSAPATATSEGEVKTASAAKPKPPDVEKQLEAVQAHIEDLEVTNRFPKKK